MGKSLKFACDAMCGGVARWLRALGHEAAFDATIDDGALVELAKREGRILISSDSRLFERRLLRDGTIRGLFLPRGLRLVEQIRFVVRELALPVLDPRCMACGGNLVVVRAEEVGDRVPARSLVWATRFFECAICGRVFWNGSHWRRISHLREQAAEWTVAAAPAGNEARFMAAGERPSGSRPAPGALPDPPD